MWPEIYCTASYLINRSPTAQFNWITPLEKLQSIQGVKNPKPKINHTRAYRCKAYALIKNRPRLDKIDPKAFIGHLVGYDSTNIYRIWIPSKNKVISTRDITFDESESYNPTAPKVDVSEEIIKTIQIPTIQDTYEESDEDDPQFSNEDTGPVMDQTSASSFMDPQEKGLLTNTPSSDSSHTLDNQLPTPQPTPNPRREMRPESGPNPSMDSSRESSTHLEVLEGSQGPRRGPRTEGIDPTNILETRRPQKPRKEAYLTDVLHIDQASGFCSAFQTGTQHHRINQRIHRTDLPPEPRTWKDLQTH